MRSAARRHRSLLAIAVLATGMFVGAGAVWAKSTLMQAEISVCLDGSGYLYQPVGGGTCRAGNLTWNQEGPVGPAGPQGPQGSQGPAGQQGPVGPSGKLVSGDLKLIKKSLTAAKVTSGVNKGYWEGSLGPVTLSCPTGHMAVQNGYSAHRENLYLYPAAPWIDEPILTASGRPIGYRMGATTLRRQYVPAGKTLSDWKWSAIFYVVCVRVS